MFCVVEASSLILWLTKQKHKQIFGLFVLQEHLTMYLSYNKKNRIQLSNSVKDFYYSV